MRGGLFVGELFADLVSSIEQLLGEGVGKGFFAGEVFRPDEVDTGTYCSVHEDGGCDGSIPITDFSPSEVGGRTKGVSLFADFVTNSRPCVIKMLALLLCG